MKSLVPLCRAAMQCEHNDILSISAPIRSATSVFKLNPEDASSIGIAVREFNVRIAFAECCICGLPCRQKYINVFTVQANLLAGPGVPFLVCHGYLTVINR